MRNARPSDSHRVCWAHTLCKNIQLHWNENDIPFIRDPRGGTRQNHEDLTWLRSGYFLRWKRPFADALADSDVTLIIFSPMPDLKMHLQELTSRPDWRQGLMDPFSLLVIVAENIFLETSVTINKVLKVLTSTEQVCDSNNPKGVEKLIRVVGSSCSRRGIHGTGVRFRRLTQHIETRHIPKRKLSSCCGFGQTFL